MLCATASKATIRSVLIGITIVPDVAEVPTLIALYGSGSHKIDPRNRPANS